MASILIIFFLVDLSLCQSFLNIEELSFAKYGVEITNKPVLFQETPPDNELHLSSKFGQPYSCVLPQQLDIGEENNDYEPKDKDSVVDLLDKSLNGTCLTHRQGWWTYKVCHKKKIEQYHVNENSEIDGVISLLGIYESEDKWSKEEKANENSKNYFHQQKYVNGTNCDLTGNPRKTFVQYYCSANKGDSIIRVEEPSTCEYIITIHSTALCKHSAFKVKEKSKQIGLLCSPVLSETEYNKYMAKKKNLKDKTEFDVDSLANIKNEEEDGNEEKDSKKKEKKIFRKAAMELNNFVKGIMGMFNTPGKTPIVQISDVKLKPVSSSSKKILDDDSEDKGELLEKSDLDERQNNLNSKLKEEVKKQNENSYIDGLNKLASKSMKMSKDLTKDILDLRSGNSKLFEESQNMRNDIAKQFKLVKKDIYAKMEKMTYKMNSLKEDIVSSENDEERNEKKKQLAKAKEDYTDLKTQLGEIRKFNSEVKNVQKNAHDELERLDKQIEEAKKFQKLFDKVLSDDKKEHKNVADTIENIFKDVNKKLMEKNDEDIKSGDGEVDEKSIKKTQNNIFDMVEMTKNNYDDYEFDDDDEDDNINLISDDDAKEKENMKVTSTPPIDIVKVLEGQMSEFSNKLKIKENQFSDDVSEELKRDIEETENTFKDSMQVRVRKLGQDEDIEKDFEKFDAELNDEAKAAQKRMEDVVKKQLKDAGVKLNDNIKIKIITSKEGFDKMGKGKGAKLLSNDQADTFKSMLMGILGGDAEKAQEDQRQQQLEENYNFVWNDEQDDVNDANNEGLDNNLDN